MPVGAERVVPAVPALGSSHLGGLLTASEKVGKELTAAFYVRYADMRQNAFEHLCRQNPQLSPDNLLSAVGRELVWRQPRRVARGGMCQVIVCHWLRRQSQWRTTS